jgi:hypothetical protein
MAGADGLTSIQGNKGVDGVMGFSVEKELGFVDFKFYFYCDKLQFFFDRCA